jgi:hypothetical protein
VPTDVMPAGRESGSAGANERQATDVPLLHYLTLSAQPTCILVCIQLLAI